MLGNFVLAHSAKVETALFDIMRVTRSGGVGFTTWAMAATPSPTRGSSSCRRWSPTICSNRPSTRRIRTTSASRAAPRRGGVARRRPATHPHRTKQYEWRYPRDDFVDGLTVWATGRFVREMLGENDWAAFMERVRATFAERFPVRCTTARVLLAIGTKEPFRQLR